MSPTIPPVLVLSLLLVPAAAARDMMDPFALIRSTLKYWLRIYQMYQQEVDLGYCWADYFLHREKDTMNGTMSRPVSVNPSNFLGDHGFPMDTSPSYARRKRSYGVSNSNDEGISEILRKIVEESEKFLIPERFQENLVKPRSFEATEDNDSRSYTRFVGDRKQDWVVLVNSDGGYRGRGSFYGILNSTEEDEILEVLRKVVGSSGEEKGFKFEPFVNVRSVKDEFSNRYSYETMYSTKVVMEEILNIFEEIVMNTDGRAPVKKSTVSEVRSKTKMEESKERSSNVEEVKNDFTKYKGSLGNVGRNVPRHDRSERFSGISKSGDADVQGISKIVENSSVQVSTTSDMLSKTGQIKFKSNKLTSNSKSWDIDLIRNAAGGTFSKDTREDRFIPANERSFEIPNFTKDKEEARKLTVEKSTSDIRGKTVKVKLLSDERGIGDSRSIDCQCREGPWFSVVVDDVGGSSLLVPSSVEQRANRVDRLSSRKIDAKSEGIEAEDGGKSKMLQVGTSRKLLYPETNRVTSGRSSRHEPTGSSLFPGRTIPSLNSRFKDSRASKELEDNREPGDFHPRWMNFGSSNRKFERVEQRPGSFRGNYRGNLRRKRDVNDRIRSSSVKPLSKSGRGSSYNPTSTDDIPRFSSRYKSRLDGVWLSNGIEPRSINSGDEDRVPGRNVPRSFASGIVDSGERPIYYLKRYRDTPLINRRTTIRASSIALEEIHDVPSQLIDLGDRTPFRTSSSRVLVKNPSVDNSEDGEEDRGLDGSSSKQLPSVNDNRYRRNEQQNLVGKSTIEEGTTGKKVAIRYLVGRPSLLPVSYPRFMGDYGDSTGGTAWNSRTSRSSKAEDQGRRSSMTKVEARALGRAFATLLDLRQAFMGFLRTLGFFVQVGRQLMDYVDSNSALVCTKNYLVGKAILWIDS
ncbi:hypothetical protein WH47_06210 [Habropoda laboriosa]|uniref:Uncharacterized protein n=1 Tax=Habropoda laboriosa TaxID=597456 RepID=A0A0L7RJZ1_9HYME|nr:hypothetical protein WH47_06210 [Habropoda laboriosa]